MCVCRSACIMDLLCDCAFTFATVADVVGDNDDDDDGYGDNRDDFSSCANALLPPAATTKSWWTQAQRRPFDISVFNHFLYWSTFTRIFFAPHFPRLDHWPLLFGVRIASVLLADNLYFFIFFVASVAAQNKHIIDTIEMYWMGCEFDFALYSLCVRKRIDWPRKSWKNASVVSTLDFFASNDSIFCAYLGHAPVIYPPLTGLTRSPAPIPSPALLPPSFPLSFDPLFPRRPQWWGEGDYVFTCLRVAIDILLKLSVRKWMPSVRKIVLNNVERWQK